MFLAQTAEVDGPEQLPETLQEHQKQRAACDQAGPGCDPLRQAAGTPAFQKRKPPPALHRQLLDADAGVPRRTGGQAVFFPAQMGKPDAVPGCEVQKTLRVPSIDAERDPIQPPDPLLHVRPSSHLF